MDQSTNLAASRNGSEVGMVSGLSYFLIKAQWYINNENAAQQEYFTALPIKYNTLLYVLN